MAHILVIDDDRDILRLLEVALVRAGHEVTVAIDGQQGLAEALARRPDLVVADVMMPRMTGYDFCRNVRANPDLAEVPIIIFSARFQPIDKETAMEAGASDYLPKTLSPEALIQRVNELLPASGTTPARAGHALIGLFSQRGGAGVTSLAVNVAVAVARSRPNQPVVLADLAPVGGHAALLLGLRPTGSVAQILSNSGGNFTMGSLKPHLLRHSSGVYLLPSALSYDHPLALTDNRLFHLMSTLKNSIPLTILDFPPILGPVNTSLLRSLDKLVLVLSGDMPALQSGVMALQNLIRLGVTESQIILVVNFTAPQGMLPPEAVQKALKRPVLLSIPYDPEMVKSVNSGKPLLLSAPQSPAARTITRLAHELAG